MKLNCNENRQNNLKWSDLIVSYLLLLSNIIALDKELFIVKQVEQRRLFFYWNVQNISIVVVKKKQKNNRSIGGNSVNRDEIIHLQILSNLHINNTI